ncbi:exodeoxyribonuclease V subunit alpha [Rhodohalobacter sp. SW132]|uniref:exodeoxyribonuclease V subunit alpha n=1 Tax=Rhodohalobacter sp. SW132 TaxID=2293433 RepID=UPI000E2643F5|nr:exodeoxyribonuclease V subunit alpha [Rhodohalobacter sp. SW132]REL33648.1 exodeoxyribonuclease V subunit alpha [Rhodohalobacter sp. SW132]
MSKGNKQTPTLFDQPENSGAKRKEISLKEIFQRHELELIRYLESEYGELSEDEKIAVALTSLFVRDGHVCMPADRSVEELIQITEPEKREYQNLNPGKLDLLHSKIIGKPGSGKPFTLIDNRLYIHRFYKQEQNLKSWIQQKSRSETGFSVSDSVKAELDRLFPAEGKSVNWQKTAAALSLFKSFLIVSGGPGTGKTTTVARMLTLLQRTSEKPLRIALAAPTGKAAGRMGEALFGELQNLNLTDEQLRSFPSEAQTIHRLLRSVEEHGLLPPVRRKMLRYDIVIVDEASMIDLSLITRLIRHLDEGTRLILLGDKDQLASVEAGSVFADLCRKKENTFNPETEDLLKNLGIPLADQIPSSSKIDDSIVYLTKSYRFDENSGIGQLAASVNRGIDSVQSTEDLFHSFDDIRFNSFQNRKNDFGKLTADIRDKVQSVQKIDTPEEALEFWKKSVWLTALRRGLSGSERLNRLAEQAVASARVVKMQKGWFHGRPIIISRNNYDLGVFNGDHGVCILQDDGNYRVFVQSGSGIKKIKPEQLTHFAPAYFLTVHKSQGSEFSQVNFLLPVKDTPILTRELLYTAITRAKKGFSLYGELELFIKASNRETERFSGL